MNITAPVASSAAVRDFGKPTQVRYKVISLAILLGMITYLDRACISRLAPDIMADLSLTKVQMGYIFSAFSLAYTIFEIPTARWADRHGSRSTLTRIVVWWSAFAMLTGCAVNYGLMLITRFLFGAGEAGAWPGVARTFSNWVPRRERGMAQGLFFAGAHLAGGLTPLLVTMLLSVLSWRMIFVVFGFLGFVWAFVWFRWFCNDPADHGEVNPAELELIQSKRVLFKTQESGWVYWKQLLRHKNMIALCLMYFPNSFVFYFCITWLPVYLKEKHGFQAGTLGFLAGLPLILSVFGDLLGGVVTDRITRRFGLRAGRCGVGIAAYLVAGFALLAAPFAPSAVMAAVLIALAVAATMFTLAAAWGTCLDVAGNNGAVVSATMNTAGQIGGLICPLFVAYTLKWFSNWDISLYLMGGLFLIGALCWWLINPNESIFKSIEAKTL